ncbi:outer membrane beta-barrel family protein [Siansivirga zeaxanthinifaciens]|uniref:Outer membrane protein beta-barrel domain-containing protein n=1 Tax=Siansivirga zeaxanthinifaciens CC-SAMT-1 TaxID=1454006 RepID=A0A0C5WD08_9FLAO|nr:outer membrane beta-barrel family protein [Siansivirga zeaxanthinifaciens]AJR04948.1 hypothetical protein AW14_12085 [Siansivirga zeaxanthinifaciens CC-SAMT-1]
MCKTLRFYLIFLLCFNAFSQDFNVRGKILDEQKIPIPFANISISKDNESKVFTGTTSLENGDFIIENLQPSNYTLNVSYLGYEAVVMYFNLNENIILKDIILKERIQSLDGVTIVSKKPTIKRLVDRVVFNVENSTLSNDNVLTILKHTPGVFVSEESITVKNTKSIVYINDKRVHLSAMDLQNLLEGTSAVNIKSIEVISNPPAKYDAEGGAIINIVTSKNIISGYNGNVYGNFKQGFKFPKYSLGTSHFFKTEKLDMYFNYNFTPREDFRIIDESINFISNNQVSSRWESDFEKTTKSANNNFNANIDFEIDKNNSLSFASNIMVAPRRQTKTDRNTITEIYSASNVLDSILQANNKLVEETINLAFTLDYKHAFKKEGEQLLVSLHHTNYDNSNFQDVNTGYFYPDMTSAFRNNRFQTFTSQYIKLFTGQVDFELPLNNGAHFETGAKITSIDSDNILKQFTVENNVKTEDLNNTDTFLYNETNYAFYISYSHDWEHWSFKSGIRSEYTDILGESVSTNQTNSNKYLKIFPNINLLNRINESNEIYFNYKKRIFRPSYMQLNPFKYYQNDYSYVTGDPNLKPQIDDVFILGYTFNKKYTFEAFYRFENNTALQIVFQDNASNILKYINSNIDRNISYGLDFTTYTSISKDWNIYVLSSIFNNDNKFVALESNNALQKNNQWSFYGQFVNYFSFLKDKTLTADLAIQYISTIAEGPTFSSERLGVDLNLRKTLWNERASLSIGMMDIFNTQNFNQTTRYLNQDIYMKSNSENRLFVFGFNYKFGNSKLETNNRSIELDERDRLESK